MLVDLDIFFNTESRLLEGDGHRLLEVTSFHRTVALGSAAEASEAASEHISEHVEYIVVASAEATETAACSSESGIRVYACVTELVIQLFLFRIAEYAVSFVDFLELFFGSLITRILIRVIFERHLSESLFISASEAPFWSPSTS